MNEINFKGLNLGVSGDSITMGEQWSYYVFCELEMASHHNTAVGSSVWYKRKYTANGVTVETQDFNAPDFAGISDGWEPTEDIHEMQLRMNNCAVVHIQKFIAEVKSRKCPPPDIFVFAYGTNDDVQYIGNAEFALEGKKKRIEDTFTEAGAMRWCIQTIQEQFPEARIFVCTPMQTGSPEHNKKIELQIESMKKICTAMSVQMIDVYGGCGVCEKYEKWGKKGRYLKDGLHPDKDGQRLQGRFILKEIVKNMF